MMKSSNPTGRPGRAIAATFSLLVLAFPLGGAESAEAPTVPPFTPEPTPVDESCGLAVVLNNRCNFDCKVGNYVSVSFIGVGSVTASCPGASASCSSLAVCSASSYRTVTRAERGECAASGAGTFSCNAG